MSEWWVATSDVDLEQGDVLDDVPVVRVGHVDLGAAGQGDTGPGGGDARQGGRGAADANLVADIEIVDAIILTQTCDLQNEKVDAILLARVVSWTAFATAQIDAGNEGVRSSTFRRNLIRGAIPPLALLHARETAPALEWSVVDFCDLFTVERSRIDASVRDPRPDGRLRLVSPHKEHFAQSFARYFMRVGLPHDAAAFETEGAAAVR